MVELRQRIHLDFPSLPMALQALTSSSDVRYQAHTMFNISPL